MNDHMTKCSNCEGSLEGGNYITMIKGRQIIAHICSSCQDGVLTLKIAVSRPTLTEEFQYEQYLPVQTAR